MIDATEQLREATAALAPLNSTLDEALIASADRLDFLVDQYGEQIQPLDGTLAFFADVLRSQTSGS
ncbi:MAG: hypothetical protein ACRDWI_09950 [Jiangellaceae bacterium]